MRFLALAAALMMTQGMPVTRLAGGVPAEKGTVQVPAQPPPSVPPPLPVTRLDPGAAAVTLDAPRRLSLSFSEPRPIEEVLRLLIAGTPFSLAIDADATGGFRGDLKQLTLREALSTVLDPLGLDFDVRGTVLRVTRDRTETRQFDLNLLAVQRGLTRTAGGGSTTVVTTLGGEDVFAGIADGVQALLSSNGRVHVDRRAGLAQVTDSAERLDRVALYLEALQVRSRRQVRLDARVFEVTLRDAAAIDWRTVREKLGLARDAPHSGVAADPAALQKALADQGDVRVLSAPTVTALNNEPALVRAWTPGASSLTLSVVPQIAADGIVQLSVSHAWELGGPNAVAHVAEADTVARVMDGATMLIAGLLRPAQVAVPAHGMGALFGGPAKKTVQAELVVLLRATIVAP
jgi:hypothetical protein